MNEPSPLLRSLLVAQVRRTAPAAAVVLAALAAYANSLAVPLVFDDVHLVDRAELHAISLAPAELARAALGFPLGRWLAFVTFAANHAVHGLRPAGYHAVNLAIHAGVALLLLAVVPALLRHLAIGDDERRRRAAAAAALLFSVHPVNTMAVTYVVQRMTSLGALLALGSVALWLRARARGGVRPGWAAGAVLLAWLAVSCKENYAVLPALVLLVELCAGLDLRAALRRRPLAAAAAGAALAVAAALAASRYWPEIARPPPEYALPVSDRLLTQGRVLWHYLSLLAFPLPSRLHVDYAWPASTGLFAPPTTLPALAGIAALAAVAVRLRGRAPLATLAIGWFLLALAIEQSVLPIDLVFEHRLYFPSLGLFVLAGWGASAWSARAPRAAAAAVAALAAALALGTHLRNEVWRDPVRLFAGSSAAGSRRHRAVQNAAVQLQRSGRLEEAERVLREAVALDPGAADAWGQLGNLALDRGRDEEAVTLYRRALALGADRAAYNLGIALERLGRRDEAVAAYERALAAEPGLTDARVNAALLRDEAGDRRGALAMLDEALRVDPGSPLARMNRALFLAEEGRDAAALADASTALRLEPSSADAHATLAAVHRHAGRADAARAAAEEALRLAPGHADAAEVLRQLAAPSAPPPRSPSP